MSEENERDALVSINDELLALILLDELTKVLDNVFVKRPIMMKIDDILIYM